MRFELERIREEKLSECKALGEKRSLISAIEKALSEDKNPVIAEVKRGSPSRGRIRDIPAAEAAKIMEGAGACAVSVLTDRRFDGSIADLAAVKQAVSIPVLRKDFIVDLSQLRQSREMGSDAVLLIVALLGERTEGFVKEARSLGLEALVESHTKEELSIALDSGADLIGINNRSLSSLKVDLGVTERLGSYVPKERILVAESGIESRDDVMRLKKAGARAFLIGSSIMSAEDIGSCLRGLVG